jgi:cysteine-rich repeat protein
MIRTSKGSTASILMGAAALLVAGCSEDGAASVCDPGATQFCACPGGVEGAQACSDDGTRWEACDCGGADADADVDGDAGADTDVDGGADADVEVEADADADTGGETDADVDDDEGETTPVCGNGIVETGEQCDDGNTVQADGCHNDCLLPRCGDGVTDLGEECDSGADNSNTRPDACRTDCRLSYCGDGVMDTGEPCDDGNADNTDDCLVGCSVASCGDGYIRAGHEACDDGNADNTDACTTSCNSARCGDGFVQSGAEDCDSVPPRSCTTACSTTGTQACMSCRWEATCMPPAEICNGVDDDCDTAADEGFACVMGATTACTTTCGTTGSGTCTATCTLPTGAVCTPPAETCNALDDDCDGATDETFECVQDRAGVSCTTSCGSTGTGVCSSSCSLPPAGACAIPAETCNGRDDNCDGVTDAEPCGFGSIGLCVMGVRGCVSGAWGPCVGAVLPAAETCDSLDNDCDGATDEGLAGDSYETNETCARARSLPRADEGFATDPLIEVTAATLLHTDGSADVDWFTISANEASHLDCGLPWEVLPQCYFYLEIHLAPPLGMDRTPWRMCVHEGGCSVGTEHCTSAADWNPTAGAYVMILPWQGTCWLDDEWTFYVRVDATSAGVRSCRPYALRYRFYFSGGAGTAFCS